MLRSDSPNLNKSEFDQDLIGLESDENWTLPIYLYIYIYTVYQYVIPMETGRGSICVVWGLVEWCYRLNYHSSTRPPSAVVPAFSSMYPAMRSYKVMKTLEPHTDVDQIYVFIFFKSGHWVFTNYVQNIYKIFTEHLDNIYNILCHTFLQNFKLLLHLFSLCSLVFLIRLLFNRC